ncbi:beta-propeller fold lactonase family protein [Pseudoalteromonas piscicida]|uniref:beta-propeller fold lactonase family protein n=1 Tax=Pseudoalteromonas piscicida TaxID=43662 RepID=UPI0030C94919
MYKPTISALMLIALGSISFSTQSQTFDVVQTIQNNTAGFSGLDNPRQLRFNHQGTQAVAVSGDDNAVVIFTLNANKQLVQDQLFQSSDAHPLLLTGASDAVFVNNNLILNTSFYDGALNVFAKDKAGKFNLVQTFSDEVSYKVVFDPTKNASAHDNLSLFAPWKIRLSDDKRYAFIPSYKSNTVTAFRITPANSVTWLGPIDSAKQTDMAGPVDVLVSKEANALIVAGYEGDVITLWQQTKGTYAVKQRIVKDDTNLLALSKPQALVASSDFTVFYVAAAGSNSILAFERQQNGQYHLLQIIDADQVGKPLDGVSSLLLTPDGKRLYAASESSSGIAEFSVNATGKLTHTVTIDDLTNPLANISALAFVTDPNHLAVSLAKQDTIKILKMRKQ